LLLIVSPTYSKKNRVESLYYLSKQDDVKGVIFESFQHTAPNPPKFYLNKKDVEIYKYARNRSKENLLADIKTKRQLFPNYIIFLGEERIESRINKFEIDFSDRLEFLVKIKPSFIDEVLYRLNPKYNRNQTSFIYKIVPKNKGD
jgi:hypothetical protein